MGLEKGQTRIRFRFDERKAAAAAALLLDLAGGEMHYLQLIKLLYYADREALERLGLPISGDRYITMQHGPVLSAVYDLVKQCVFGKPPTGPWSEHIEAAGRYKLRLRARPELGPLSEAEAAIIREVFARHRGDRWELRDKTHKLPEWEDPGTSAHEIPVETILQVLGKTDAEIEEIRQAARERSYFTSLFGR